MSSAIPFPNPLKGSTAHYSLTYELSATEMMFKGSETTNGP